MSHIDYNTNRKSHFSWRVCLCEHKSLRNIKKKKSDAGIIIKRLKTEPVKIKTANTLSGGRMKLLSENLKQWKRSNYFLVELFTSID